MAEQIIVCLVREAFYTALVIYAPVLLLSLFTGLVVSMVRAGTSMQEFTLEFVPKLFVIAVMAVLALPWIARVVVALSTSLVTPGSGAVAP